jgi:hypothetical protein
MTPESGFGLLAYHRLRVSGLQALRGAAAIQHSTSHSTRLEVARKMALGLYASQKSGVGFMSPLTRVLSYAHRQSSAGIPYQHR